MDSQPNICVNLWAGFNQLLSSFTTLRDAPNTFSHSQGFQARQELPSEMQAQLQENSLMSVETMIQGFLLVLFLALVAMNFMNRDRSNQENIKPSNRSQQNNGNGGGPGSHGGGTY